MKKSPWVPVLALAACMVCAAARADMIDTKRDGAMDGTIVSEDAATVVFKDSHGQTHAYPRAEIQLLEKSQPAARGGGVQKVIGDRWASLSRSISKLNLADAFSGRSSKPSPSGVTSSGGSELTAAHYHNTKSLKAEFNPTQDLRSMVLWAWVLIGALGIIYYNIRLIIAAFQTSIVWGVAYLLIPGAQLVFWACHWDKAGYFALRSLLFTAAMVLAYLFLLF